MPGLSSSAATLSVAGSSIDSPFIRSQSLPPRVRRSVTASRPHLQVPVRRPACRSRPSSQVLPAQRRGALARLSPRSGEVDATLRDCRRSGATKSPVKHPLRISATAAARSRRRDPRSARGCSEMGAKQRPFSCFGVRALMNTVKES
jgi:hypothetical protein